MVFYKAKTIIMIPVNVHHTVFHTSSHSNVKIHPPHTKEILYISKCIFVCRLLNQAIRCQTAP